MILFQYNIEKSAGSSTYLVRQTNMHCYGGALSIGVDNTYCFPRWRARIGPDTDRHCGLRNILNEKYRITNRI